MIVIVVLLLIFAAPFTGFMFLDVLTGLMDAFRRLLNTPVRERPPPRPEPERPEVWWRWQRTQAWYEEQDRRSNPPKPVQEQPTPKRGRPIQDTWESMGDPTGVINLRTGEVFEPGNKGEGGTTRAE